jgi:hypothetical protein
MTLLLNPRLTLLSVFLLLVLPTACGERTVLLEDPTTTQDGSVPAHDATNATTDGVAMPAPDLLSMPDFAPSPSPCCKAPVCVNQGSNSEGWSDPCNSQPVKLDYCSTCEVACKDCGPGCKDNGWYTFCPYLKLVRACDCKDCKPRCLYPGTDSEGWYDGCTGKLINWADCGGCKAICHDPNQPALGQAKYRYYSSCDKTKPLTKTLCIP